MNFNSYNQNPHGNPAEGYNQYQSGPSNYQNPNQPYTAQNQNMPHSNRKDYFNQPQETGANLDHQNNNLSSYEVFGLPNLGNNPAAQFGMQFAGDAMNAMQENVGKSMERYISMSVLKHYFDVTNHYVLTKLKTLTFPWFHKRWYRYAERDSSGQFICYKSPREDANSFDLYIPLMAFITYVTCVGIVLGYDGK
ncbi:hypothetical protein BB558_004836 [Smittium angustum]|nr:hypothetical protein BB558_004836 [Smittium angustum]